jgi:hypothetical protein
VGSEGPGLGLGLGQKNTAAIFKLELSFSRSYGSLPEALLETKEEMERMGTGKETETANEKEKGVTGTGAAT